MDLARFDKTNFTAQQINGSGLRPDYNFNVRHNAQVLAETNREADNRERALDEQLDKMCGNVADILAHYARHTLIEGKHTSIDKYIGKVAMKSLYENRLMAKYASDKAFQ